MSGKLRIKQLNLTKLIPFSKCCVVWPAVTYFWNTCTKLCLLCKYTKCFAFVMQYPVHTLRSCLFCILRYVIFETVDRIINRMKYQMSYVQEAFSLYIMHSLNYNRYLGISVWKRAIYFWQMYLAVSYYEKIVVQYIVWHDRNQDSLERVLDLYSSTNNYLV